MRQISEVFMMPEQRNQRFVVLGGVSAIGCLLTITALAFVQRNKDDDAREAVLRYVYRIGNPVSHIAPSGKTPTVYVFQGRSMLDVSPFFLSRFQGSIPAVETGQTKAESGFVFGNICWLNDHEATVEAVKTGITNKIHDHGKEYHVMQHQGNWVVTENAR